MRIPPHDLPHELPDLVDVLQDLRARDAELAARCDEYERLNAHIVDIEENDKPFVDLEFEELKKRRLRLKDEIFAALMAHRR
jgi:hypothetical protein